MNIYIDISVFLKEERSLGQIHGNVELPCVPGLGTYISFSSPAKGTIPFICEGFSTTLKVTAVQLIANSPNQNVIVSLEDLVLSSESDANAVMEYLRVGFALFVDESYLEI